MNEINISDLGPEVSPDFQRVEPSQELVDKWKPILELHFERPRRLLNMEEGWYQLVHNYIHEDCYIDNQYYTIPEVDPKDYMEASALLESIQNHILSNCTTDSWSNPCRKLKWIIPTLRTRMTMVPCDTPEDTETL